jgi:hypothetical protein
MSKMIILVLLSAIMSFAANHYVSNNGTASWAASTNIATPCSTRVAFDSAQAGDTAFFRGGTYTVPEKNFGNVYTGYYGVPRSGSSGNPIVFMAYPAETPLFDGTTGGWGDTTSTNNGVFPFATIFSTNNHSYITFDGFHFQADGGTKMGRVWIGSEYSNYNGNGYVVFKNCVLNGGNPVSSDFNDNQEVLRVEGAKNITVSNCYFYNCRNAGEASTASAWKSYDDSTVTIENCEFYNCDIAIFLKSKTPNATIHNCFMHACDKALYLTPEYVGMLTDSIWMYNNLVIDAPLAAYHALVGAEGSHGNNVHIYNNTFYNCGNTGAGDPAINIGLVTTGHGTEVYNNIFLRSPSYSISCQTLSGTSGYILKAVDHNQYGTSSFHIITKRGWDPTHYTDLASWQASNELESAIDVGCGSSQHPGCGSLTSDPLLADTSSNEIAGFEIGVGSPCLGAGRGGADIGCDISTVGIDYEYVPGTQYTLTMANDGHGTTTPSGAVVLDSAEGQAISASPSGGYVFANWSVTAGSGVLFNGDSSRCSLTVSSATVQANFEMASEVHADSNAFVYNNTHYTGSGTIYFPILVKATIVKDSCKTYLKNAAGTIVDSTAVLSENERDTLHGTFAAGTWKLISKTVR